jgi:hypothetical protein
MCFPKAPRADQDPEVKAAQKEQRADELARLSEEKRKSLIATRRTLRGSGVRSLISGSGAGYGSNYTG